MNTGDAGAMGDAAAPLDQSPSPDGQMPPDDTSLGEQTQEPQVELPDDKLAEYGLNDAQIGDIVTAKVTFRVDGKTPGDMGAGGSGAGMTTLAIQAVADVEQGAGDESDESDESGPPSEDDNGSESDGDDGDNVSQVGLPDKVDETSGPGGPGGSDAAGPARAGGWLSSLAKKKPKSVSPKEAGFRK